MKTQNRFLKHIVLASIVVACVVSNVQAMGTDVSGPARQKYENFNMRRDKIHPYMLAVTKAGIATFAAGISSVTAGLLMGNATAKNVGTFISILGYVATFGPLSADLWCEIYSDHLHSKVEIEEQNVTE